MEQLVEITGKQGVVWRLLSHAREFIQFTAKDTHYKVGVFLKI